MMSPIFAFVGMLGSGTGLRWEVVSQTRQLPPDTLKGGFYNMAGRDFPVHVGRVAFGNAIVPARIWLSGGYYYLLVTWKGVLKNYSVFEVSVKHSL